MPHPIPPHKQFDGFTGYKTSTGPDDVEFLLFRDDGSCSRPVVVPNALLDDLDFDLWPIVRALIRRASQPADP